MKRQALVVAMVAACLPLTAGHAEVRVRTLEVVRTTSGPATMQLDLSASTASQPTGFEGSFTGRVGRNGQVADVVSLGARVFGHDDPSYTASGRATRVCPTPAGSCVLVRTLAYADTLYLDDKGGAEALNRFWVVLEGDFEVHLKGHGWAVRSLPIRYRYRLSEDSARAGAYAGTTSAELSGDTALPGARRGSLAVMMPPCSRSSSVPLLAEPAPRGLGRLTLSGGRQDVTVTCPADVTAPYPTAVASGPTTWRATGTAVGDSSFQTVRLFVVDL